MLIVSYDFANDKVRTRFAKFLSAYGQKIQYSVYSIKNSQRILANILTEIDASYKREFKNTDSILIFSICDGCMKKIKKYGSAGHDNEDVVYFD